MSLLHRDPALVQSAERIQALGHAEMDTIHSEFDALLQRARLAADDRWLPLLAQIDAHLRAHFEAEDRWMLETDFPPRNCHIDEHAAVLRSSAEVLELARRGDMSAARLFINELTSWFPGHADYLDSALAAWLCKRRYGGKPLMLRR